VRGLISFIAWLLAGAGLAIPAIAQAQIPLVVTTTEDLVTGNNNCSLREAIIAANTNSPVDLCVAGLGSDSIRFGLGSGTPQIDILSPLPDITAPVSIRGNTGGATRVVLHRTGGGSFAGLVIKANGTTVESLVINNFAGHGIVIQANNVTVTGSLIGTAADGITPLGNTGNGIAISGPAAPSNHVIGGTGAGQANVIAYNQIGVSVAGSTGNAIRGNSIHDNGGVGIDNTGGGNGELAPPQITQADVTVSGTSGCASCTVDVFADSATEGQTYLGSTTTNGSGAWTLGTPPPGPYVTATVTNTSGSTSEFSTAHACRNFDADALCDGVDDSDLDGIADAVDNCMLAPNGPALPDTGGNSQLDVGGDGYGNLCDADLNGSGLVTSGDYIILRNALNTNNPAADLNGSGLVTSADYLILRSALNQPPGPSGAHRPP